MRALVCLKPGELALEDRPEPRRADGEVLVQILRIGICGTDYHIFEGSHPYLQYPRVMGHELSGEVLEAPDSSELRPGQRVVINPYISCGHCIACRSGKPNCCVRIAVLGVHRDGGMCERISLPAGNVYPAGPLSLDQAAGVEFLAIGAHSVSRSRAAPGDKALVIGAGPIGLGVAAFARIAGCEVTVMDRDAERLAFAMSTIGTAHAIMGGDTAAAAIAELTGGDGFTMVFDATGSRSSMETAFQYVAHGGTLTLVSVVNEQIGFSDPAFHQREMTLAGSRNALKGDFAHVVAAIADGSVPLDKLITHRTTLEGARTQLPVWTTAKRGLVKALIEVD